MEAKTKHLGVSFFVGFMVAAISITALQPARAEVDAVSAVKDANKESYDVLHDVGECLRHSVGKIDYVKAQLHENNTRLSF